MATAQTNGTDASSRERERDKLKSAKMRSAKKRVFIVQVKSEPKKKKKNECQTSNFKVKYNTEETVPAFLAFGRR